MQQSWAAFLVALALVIKALTPWKKELMSLIPRAAKPVARKKGDAKVEVDKADVLTPNAAVPEASERKHTILRWLWFGVRVVFLLLMLGIVLAGMTVVWSWRNSTAPVTLGNASFLTMFLLVSIAYLAMTRDGRG